MLHIHLMVVCRNGHGHRHKESTLDLSTVPSLHYYKVKFIFISCSSVVQQQPKLWVENWSYAVTITIHTGMEARCQTNRLFLTIFNLIFGRFFLFMYSFNTISLWHRLIQAARKQTGLRSSFEDNEDLMGAFNTNICSVTGHSSLVRSYPFKPTSPLVSILL
jgi:hypothetical protein